MVQPVAKIRQYEPSDEKLVLFTVGKANLELLAAANSRGTFCVNVGRELIF